MAKREDTTYFEKKLLEFVGTKDPMLEMLQWVMDKFMEIEVSQKTGAEKGERTEDGGLKGDSFEFWHPQGDIPGSGGEISAIMAAAVKTGNRIWTKKLIFS